MKKNVFRSIMALHNDTQKDIADALGITEQTVSDKINGLSEFKAGEIKLLIARYDLTPIQVDDIFFGEEI